MIRIFAALLLAAGPAVAECPPSQDIEEEETALFELIGKARHEGEARFFSNRLWKLWTRAPDERAQALLDDGMDASHSWDFATALDAFDELTEYCPDFAESYNQRAFVRFRQQEFEAALVDLDRAIRLSPRHVGAISGKALTLMGLGRREEAQRVLREALALNPWLSERHLLEGEEL